MHEKHEKTNAMRQLDRKKAVEDFYARYTSQTLCQP